MSLGFITALRNNMLDEITALIDAGADGLVRIYDGTQPATGGAVTTLLAEGAFSTNSAPAASGGVLTHSAIGDEASAPNGGTPTWYRIVDSTAAFVMDGTAGTSGTDMILDAATITAGQTVSFNSSTITAGNV
ncbi:MAG: hypothetical protein COA94_04695 [Rickettsiales bacterium]|nr:MAG: hypothetical protein COA94_04695 [Rickettsiales bacterium]